MSNGQGRPIFPVSIGVQQVRLRDYFAEERKRLEEEIEGIQLPVSSQSDTCKPLTFASDAPTVADILLVALGSAKPASEGVTAPCNPGYALLGAAPDTKLDAVRLPGSSKAAAAALVQLFQMPSAQQVASVQAPQPGETSALRQCMIDLVKGAPPGLPSFWLSDAKDTCLAAKHSGLCGPQVGSILCHLTVLHCTVLLVDHSGCTPSCRGTLHRRRAGRRAWSHAAQPPVYSRYSPRLRLHS
jgi:hypothetical protein